MFKKDNHISPSGQTSQIGKVRIDANEPNRKNSRSTASGNRTHPSIIAQDVKIEGSIHSQGDIQIDGAVQGDIRASKAVIGSEGSVNGELIARNVIVHGKLKGTIQAAKVQLCSGSGVEGDIVQSSLIVDPEARFTGQIRRPDDKPSGVVIDNQRTRIKTQKTSIR